MKRLCLLLASTLALAPTAFAAFKCTDEKGVTHIGDTPPEPCANVLMLETSPSGTVIKRIEPSLTAEQVKALRDGAEKRKEDERAAAEQARKDSALLNTYASDREIDMTRDRNIEPVNGRIKVTKERIAGVEKRRKEIEDEMEFYKAGKSKAGKTREAPANLVHDLERLKDERVTLEKSLASYDKEIEMLRAKYDNDKKRWIALKNAPDPKAQPVKSPAR
ncbi:MAG: DUF4124 domain-containing protein [Burkholderiales bacterium]|nr:DUF4124 domain-containing protein [Burkholderiales bacterium]